ncbi:hypothetical protein C2845_PM08G04880 [Panicum miliaceum]|uniref:Uncharacterized protein n=1 Tax=Panicum miliaceum TaxID=4540 RepID=A0A3L6QZF7_PANMI|nr:hypothetical protein C2845_PM08G04880 [Panicum miliaceum]
MTEDEVEDEYLPGGEARQVRSRHGVEEEVCQSCQEAPAAGRLRLQVGRLLQAQRRRGLGQSDRDKA